MMENQPWPSKHQQSVALSIERTDSLNNDNCEYPSDKTDSSENAGKDDPENGINTIQEPNLGNNFTNCSISEKSQQAIQAILDQIRPLTPVEKFLLYLKLPTDLLPGLDPLRQPLNPLGNRSEIYRTISWIRTHLREDPETSLPKQEVYTEYNEHCNKIKIKPLSQADFGKVMKQVYPKVRARRLGVRGQSKYCYAGLIRCTNLSAPKLPDLGDKLMSTEAPCTQSSLALAAWFIVKQWSEKQLGKEFANLEALAFYLVVEHSVGAGTKAANQLKSQSHIKDEDVSCNKGFNKHRETQLQLQKKILGNEANKKRKRKMQCPKLEEKQFSKKPKPQTTATSSTLSQQQPLSNGNVNINSLSSPVMTTTPASSSEGVTPASTPGGSSTSTSPTQGKPICDKSLDFTQLSALPDFNSFQKPTAAAAVTVAQAQGKVAIPRLGAPPASKHSHLQQHRAPTAPTNGNNAKYKAIQPKPCDIASYNPQQPMMVAAEIRSQQAVHNVDKFNKERKGSDDDDCDVPELPLPRERLDSISNVEKDAMDEYLGTGNSQHEEELSKYFSNNSIVEVSDTTIKLSQLRQMLEQNGIAATERIVPQTLIQNHTATLIPNESIIESPVVTATPLQGNTISYIPSHMLPHTVNSTARRRVSFENLIPEETVPPSPNTRRKNFSFTPISPAGRQSPNGRQSKSSSTNASPFVSPRNTPIPRCKNNTHQNAGIMLSNINNNISLARKNLSAMKIKKEPDLIIDIKEELTSSYTGKDYMAVSAPSSPRLNDHSVLQKLLNSDSKVAYTPDYASTVQAVQVSSTNEIDQLLISEQIQHVNELNFRSHSVPVVASMKTPAYPLGGNQFLISDQNPDFNNLDPIPETQTEVNQIISTLEDQVCENNNINGIDVFSVGLGAAQNLNQYGLIIENNLELQSNYGANTTVQFENNVSPEIVPCPRSLVRSQSIDVVGSFEAKCPPSRSVPSTPLPFARNIKPLSIKTYPNQISRSYPSTPVVTTDTFNYNNLNRDCLLNGQPIRNEGLQNSLNGLIDCTEWNGDTSLEQDKNFNIEGNTLAGDEFRIVENENSLIDDNCILIPDQNFNSNINN